MPDLWIPVIAALGASALTGLIAFSEVGVEVAELYTSSQKA